MDPEKDNELAVVAVEDPCASGEASGTHLVRAVEGIPLVVVACSVAAVAQVACDQVVVLLACPCTCPVVEYLVEETVVACPYSEVDGWRVGGT